MPVPLVVKYSTKQGLSQPREDLRILPSPHLIYPINHIW